MTAPKGHEPGLPDAFAPPGNGGALYEDVKYEEYWQSPARVRQDALEKHLISEMLPVHGRRILDLGCGYGRLAPCYLDRFDSVVLCDGSMSLLHQAREAVGDRAIFVAGDVERLPFKPASFDTVLSIRVLQHVHDLETVLAGMRHILSRDGQLLFSYHNKRNARRVLHYLASRRIANPFGLESAEVSATLLSHHPRRMAAILADAGFSTPEYRGAMVMDSLAQITEKASRTAPSGARWSSFTGRHWLAPWLIGQALPCDGEALLQADSVDELLACPACGGSLRRAGDAFDCTGCEKSYPVRDGIIDSEYLEG